MSGDVDVLARHKAAAAAAAAIYLHPVAGKRLAGFRGFTVDRVFTDGGSGFEAAGFVRGNALILAFCGSNEVIDLASGAVLARCQYEPNRSSLIAYAADRRWTSLIITGHSLGGGLAQYLAYDLARDWPPDRPAPMVVTFNGLGGAFGLMQMHGAIDAAIVKRLDITAYAHPDDVIVRIGRQLGGSVRLLVCDRIPLPPLQTCHGMRQFLSKGDACPLATAYEHPDRPYAIMQSATIIGDELQAAVLAAHGRHFLRAIANIMLIWWLIPFGERLEVVRFLVSLTPARRYFRRSARFWHAGRARLSRLHWPHLPHAAGDKGSARG